MSKKKKKNDNIKLLVIVLIALLLIIVFGSIISRKNNITYERSSANVVGIAVTDNSIDELADKTELEKVKTMSERTRIEYYVAKFIKLVENQDYETAYSFLNDDYKNNYFRSLREFEEYCKSNFSSMPDVKYENFERNGDLYVVWITIEDSINGRQNAGKDMNFVVKENGFNDYELSFSK